MTIKNVDCTVKHNKEIVLHDTMHTKWIGNAHNISLSRRHNINFYYLCLVYCLSVWVQFCCVAKSRERNHLTLRSLINVCETFQKAMIDS